MEYVRRQAQRGFGIARDGEWQREGDGVSQKERVK